MTNAQDLERLLHWSDPKPISTARGPRLIRNAEPTNLFWALWRSEKPRLQSLGISPRLITSENRWIVSWFTEVPAVPAAAVPAVPVVPADAPADAPAPVLEAATDASAIPQVTSDGRRWSDEQMAIFNWFVSGTGSLVVRARAGTGKTTTLKQAFTYAKEDRMLYAVFNKKNQREAVEAITDPRVEVKTLHSVGFMFIQQVWPHAKPSDDVENFRIEKVVGDQTPNEVKSQIRKLVGFAKNLLVNPTVEELVDLADERDIDCPNFEEAESGGWNRIRLAACALQVMELSKQRDPEGRISFNDMVWLPVAMNWTRAWYDLVVVDEAQDMNLPQLLMAKAACKHGGRVCVVGDDRQAIYHFRGAASDGMDMMRRTLNARELGLTITYRCPKAVVALAAKLVPDYKAADTAPAGTVESLHTNAVVNSVKAGNAVLSRSNAPLMSMCLDLLRKGIPARIEGRDLGKALLDIVKKLSARTVPQFLTRVENWADKQIARFENTKHFEEKSAQINDQAETLIAIAEGASSVAEIETRLNTLFGDSTGEEPRPVVVLSSTHKAKGLEWEKVYLLSDTYNRKRPANSPSVSPETAAAQAREEANIYYVALTRAKSHLVLASINALAPHPVTLTSTGSLPNTEQSGNAK